MHRFKIGYFVLASGFVFFLSAGLVAHAQGKKAGLWEMTTTMTFQQGGFPNAPAGPVTVPVCVTQAEIDRYGAFMSGQQGRFCELQNVVKTPTSMTADMVCTGPMSGKGTIQSTVTGSTSATGKVHFTGTMKMGQTVKPVEWTSSSSSVFKSSDCGDVKPRPVEPNRP